MGEIIVGNFVQVTIDGIDRTSHVVSYTRFSDLCEIGNSFTLVLSSDYPVTLNPYQSIVITEDYDGSSGTVLRGYIIDINQDFDGEFNIVGQDKSILLFDHFISDQIKSTGESVDFWIQFYANEVGLTVEFQASASNTIVEEGTLMGLQTAGEGILTLERLAAYFIRFDSILDKLIAFRLGDSEPVITVSSVIDAKRELGTEKTRNIVKVYGGSKFSLIPGEPTVQLFSKAQSNIPELLVDKTVVVNSPALRRQTFLDIVADRILGTVNSVDDLQYYSIPKLLPNLEVGQIAEINITHSPHINYQGDRKITSLEAKVDNNGAITIIGVGQKCERISIQFPIPPVYATTNKDGVAVSFDGGDNFNPSNTGLTGLALSGLNIAANSYGRQMVLTEAGLYRRFSSQGAWTVVPSSLEDPVNPAEDSPAPTISGITIARVVDEPTNIDIFHVMATWLNDDSRWRTWVYTTKDFGNSWTSSGISITTEDLQSFWDTSGNPVTSGVLFTAKYNFQGLDIQVPATNNVYVLGNLREPILGSIYWASHIAGEVGKWHAGYWDEDGVVITGPDFDILEPTFTAQVEIFSVPNNRNIAYAVNRRSKFVSPDKFEISIMIYRTTNKGLTWTKIYHVNGVDTGGSFAKPMWPMLLDPSSLGATSRGVVKLAVGLFTQNFSEGGGSISEFRGKAYIITDNFDGNVTGSFGPLSSPHIFITKENLLGSFAWRSEEDITPKKWSSTYNLNSSNEFSFGLIIYNDLDDLTPSQEPPYDPDIYEKMHVLTFNTNFLSGITTPGIRRAFEPFFGYNRTQGGKSPTARFRSNVVAKRANGPTYVRLRETDGVFGIDPTFETIDAAGWSETDISKTVIDPGIQQYTSVTKVAILQNVSNDDYHYISSDGVESAPIDIGAADNAVYQFYSVPHHYWITTTFSGGGSDTSLFKAEPSNPTSLISILGPVNSADVPPKALITGGHLSSNDIRSFF